MRTITLLIVLVSACLGQPSRADRFASNAGEFSGVIPFGVVSGNVTSSSGGVITINTTAAHNLVAGDRVVLASCATSALNATWTVSTVPLTTRVTIAGSGVNDANSATCSMTSWRTLAPSRTFYVSGVVITNNGTSARTVNLRDKSTNCNAGPCRVGVPLNLSIEAGTVYVMPLPWISAVSGMEISGSAATDLEYRVVGAY